MMTQELIGSGPSTWVQPLLMGTRPDSYWTMARRSTPSPRLMPSLWTWSLGPWRSWQVTRWAVLSRGIGGVCTGAIGYVVFRAQIGGIPSYDEEQVALVVDDSSYFTRKVPVILGTPTLHRVVKCMKKSEMESAPPE